MHLESLMNFWCGLHRECDQQKSKTVFFHHEVLGALKISKQLRRLT